MKELNWDYTVFDKISDLEKENRLLKNIVNKFKELVSIKSVESLTGC